MTDDDLGIAAQIAAVQRELEMRQRVYPGLIARGKMTRSTAEYEFSAMRAVLRTLERVSDEHERAATKGIGA